MSGSSTYKIIGVMSGTSLDGLDLALCEFENRANSYSYKILKAQTFSYSDIQKEKLRNAHLLTAENYSRLDYLYGKYISDTIQAFLKEHSLSADAISSHGHTVFHQPKNGFSVQVGSGAAIAAESGITTVCDFRSLDVALKGQGAPLVPIGDKYLFSDFESCLNLGGIANISFDNETGDRIAFDICPVNMALNHFSKKAGKEYDNNGELAKQGICNGELLDILNNLSFYSKKGAKSLGREWFEQQFLPIVENYQLNVSDTLNTLVHHIAGQIAATLNANELNSVLVSGGGAFNSYLIEVIQKKFSGKIHIPDEQTINFKEALIFAFLGYLRLNNQINTLRSVTGAIKDSIGGAVYSGNK